MKASLLLLVLAIGISAQIKKPEPPAVKVPFAESLQAIVVSTDDWTATSGDAELYERKDLKSKWKAVGKEFEVVGGRTGLAWAQDWAPGWFPAEQGHGRSRNMVRLVQMAVCSRSHNASIARIRPPKSRGLIVRLSTRITPACSSPSDTHS